MNLLLGLACLAALALCGNVVAVAAIIQLSERVENRPPKGGHLISVLDT